MPYIYYNKTGTRVPCGHNQAGTPSPVHSTPQPAFLGTIFTSFTTSCHPTDGSKKVGLNLGAT